MTEEQQLSLVLRDFARTLVTDFSIQTILDHLVGQTVSLLPIDSAGATLLAPGSGPRYLSASDGAAMRWETLQSELGRSPAVAAHASGQPVLIPDLRMADAFPEFADRALAEGLTACFTFPLRQGESHLGALALYRGSPGPLSARSVESATTLADVAAAYILNARARGDLEQSAEYAWQVSLHDDLTGLPNRTLLMERVEHAVARCRRSGKSLAILFADLDDFKSINDRFGHHVGDELLIAISRRLTHLLRPGDTLARLAGDEFVILCEDLEDASQATQIAKRIEAKLLEEFVLSAATVQVSASLGIAFSGVGDQVPHQILAEADAAMYQAKRRGGGTHGILDMRERNKAADRIELAQDLTFALGRGELRNEYQPIVSTQDGQVTAAEVLLRWDHPTKGAIPPRIAIALAERATLIGEIGTWVLRRACEDRRRWKGQGPGERPPRLWVNVSIHQLMTPSFAESVRSVLTETGTDPLAVTLEITETVFIQDKDRALVVLRQLKAIGVTIALDDFGTGYASLNYLKQYPIDFVKVDRTFIDDIEQDSTDRLIVASIVTLAHGLDMEVVAEGIETLGQLTHVAALGCDTAQGFYFSPPLSSEDFNKQLTQDYKGLISQVAIPTQRSQSNA